MKKTIFFVALAVALVACEKVPQNFDRDGEFMVYTVRGEDSDFSGYSTYNIGDSVLVVYGKEAKYSTSSNALALVDETKEQMEAMGYTFEADPEKADVGLQLTYMEETDTYVSYMSDPYWWLDYPGYWGAGYWGGWSGWYHPYPVTYSSSTTTFMIDMVDLTADDASRLPVIWSAFAGGYTGYSSRNDLKKIEIAIGQAFGQSSYLRKTE